MHIRPESSFARSGFSSTVMENNSGQILAKPSPAATTPAYDSHFTSAMKTAAPKRPSRAETRKKTLGLSTHQNETTEDSADGKRKQEYERSERVSDIRCRLVLLNCSASVSFSS